MKKSENIQPSEVINLIRKLPESEKHLHICPMNGAHCVTNEWLIGAFAGCAFEGNSYEEATLKLIDYLYEEKNHDTMVGKIIKESGFPNLELVYEYCKEKDLEEVQNGN